MVDDFLDTSKLRARLLKVDRKPHTVDEVYKSVRPVLLSRAKAKNITLKESIPQDLPDVFCDIEKVGRILINLIINAIKFSPDDAEILVWAKPTAAGDVEVGITDQGPGMSEDDVAILGNRLQQTATGQRSSVKGFGLGLNIAKDLIRVNLGQLDVVSAPNQGSTFSFTLPGLDMSRILDRYIDTLLKQDPESHVSMLHVKPLNDAAKDIERVRHHLVCHCQSLDLVVPSDDKRSIILLGSTSEPDSWVRSIEASLEQNSAPMSLHKQPLQLDISWVGTWSNNRLKSAVIENASRLIWGEKKYA